VSVTAKFVADFTSFNSAVEKAETQLKSFQTGAAGVEKQLARVTDSFSGRKLIQDAILSAEAVDRIGGASKLTSSELQRVGAQAAAAAEKMKAMGIEVPERLEKLAKSIEPIPQQLTLSSKAANLFQSSFGQMVGAFSAASLIDKGVGALIGFGKEAFDSAGKVVDLADKTGLSTEAIQRMQFVAIQTGSSLDNFTDAAFKLSTRLGAGSSGVRGAVDALGLSFAQIRTLSPDKQFETITAALGKVDDATRRNTLGVELFGKSYSNIAAAVSSDMADLASRAQVSSDAQIRALSAAGDKWDEYKGRVATSVRTILGTIVEAGDKADAAIDKLLGITDRVPKERPRSAGATQEDVTVVTYYAGALRAADAAVAKLTKSQRDQLDAAIKLGANQEALNDLVETFGVSATHTDAVLKRYTATQREQETQSKAVTKATKDEAAAARELQDALSALHADMMKFDEALDKAEARQATEDMKDLVDEVKNGSLAFDDAAASASVALTAFEKWQRNTAGLSLGMPNGVMPDNKASEMVSKNLFGKVLEGAKDLTSGMNNIFQSAFEGGGGVGGAVKSFATMALKAGLSAIPAVGPFLAQFSGAITAGFSKIFGGLFGGEGKKTNNERDAWIAKNFGSSDQLRKLAVDAGVADATLRQLFSTKKVEDFQRIAQQVSEQIGVFGDEQAADLARLDAAVQKYGFSMEELGPKLQKQKLNEQAKELIEDWRVLVEAGIDIGVVNEKMADSINEYLEMARKTGTEVPSAMRAIIQKMIDQGTVTDEAGNAITDMGQLGISWAETMTEGFDRVVQKLDELIEKLLAAGEAIGNMPDVAIGTEGLPGEGYAAGTGGRFVNFGAGRAVTLHGRERVMTEGEAAGGSGEWGAVLGRLEAIERGMGRRDAILPYMIRDALVVAG
jgi:hypothetical protein